MITGFNTDIKHDGVTYHVQTEDKGLKTPFILSLVYNGGTILASKRSPYEDLIKNFDEKNLEKRLNRQHKLICAAIRAGRIEDLKRMTLNSSSRSAKNQKVSSPTKLDKSNEILASNIKRNSKSSIPKSPSQTKSKKAPVRLANQKSEEPKKNSTKIPLGNSKNNKSLNDKNRDKRLIDLVPDTPKSIYQELGKSEELKQKEVIEAEVPKSFEAEKNEKQKAESSAETVWDIPIIEDVTIVDEAEIKEDEVIASEIILPPEAVEIVGDLEKFGSLLEDELKVEILGETNFNSGERKNINILVCRGDENASVADANVMLKVIGADFRPLIYHSKTDSNGIATVYLKLPAFRSGRAAILIRAIVDGEETELRRSISTE